MLCILKLVWLCDRLLGLRVDRWCPRATLVSGPTRLTNRESREALKNEPTIEDNAPVPTRLIGANILPLCMPTCLWTACVTCMKFIENRPDSRLFMACMWWPDRRLTLLMLVPEPTSRTRHPTTVTTLLCANA